MEMSKFRTFTYLEKLKKPICEKLKIDYIVEEIITCRRRWKD